jgi:hypothetical protein
MIDRFHSNGTQLTKNVFSIITLRSVDMDRYQAGQKLDACRKDRYSVREGVVAGSVPQGSFQEHAGALANLQHWAVRAVVSLAPVRGGVELYAGQIRHMTDTMGLTIGRVAGRTHVLAGQDVAAQIDGDAIGLIHAALLAQAGCRPPTAYRVDEAGRLATNSLNVGGLTGTNFVEGQIAIGVQFVWPQRMGNASLVIGVDEAALSDGHRRIPGQFDEKALDGRARCVLAVDHRVEADTPLRCQASIQRHDCGALFGVMQRVGATHRLARTIVRDAYTEPHAIEPIVDLIVEQRTVGDDG